MAGPGQMLGSVEHAHTWLRASLRNDQIGERRTTRRLRHQIAAQIIGRGDSGGQSHGREFRRQHKQPGEIERQQIAALGCHQRMQFVEHDAAQRAKEIRRVGGSEQQSELFRRGQQNVWRLAALSLPLRSRRIARAGFQPHVKPHLAHRDFQVARDVDGKRLERGDVEGVEARNAAHGFASRDQPLLPCPHERSEPRGAVGGGGDALCARQALLIQLHQSGQKTGQRLAATSGRDQQHRAPIPHLRQQVKLVRARLPAAAGEPAQERLGQP